MADEDRIDTDFAPEPAPPMSPRDRLAAFEQEMFKDSTIDPVRIGGRLERGSGSAFAALPENVRAKHAAFERLVEAHDKLDAAQAALAGAEMEAANAEIAVENA